jgi:probable HAF family extracellular repeat protein
MLQRKLFAAISLLSALLAPLYGQAAPLYTVSFLAGVDFAPTGMNNAGQIAGFAGTGAGGIHAVLYSGGALHDLGGLGGLSGTNSYAQAINDAGAMTGSFLSASGEQHAFLYQDGAVLDLGAGTAGYGINAHGDVVGSLQTASGATGFIYTAGKLTALGNLGSGTEGLAVAINDHGTVAGDSTTTPDPSSSARHPFLYQGGALHDLGALGARPINGVVAINNAGQVAGYSGEADAYTHAFLYEGGVMRDLGGLGDGPLEIHDLNVHGTLVGTAFNEDEGLIPFMNLGDRLVDLNTLLDPALGWHLTSAYANNDLGQIVGYGCQGAACGLVRLDLAGAVPEPAPVSLLASGLLAFGWRRGWLRRNSPVARGAPSASPAIPPLAAPPLSPAV